MCFTVDEEIKILAGKLTDKIYRKIRKTSFSDLYKMKSNVGIGADGTPTKYIDKIAEDIAMKALKKSKIDVNLLSEEVGFIDNGADYTFVLDPVDGTRNACRGIPFYSVSLAIGRKKLSDINYGIVKNIPTGDVFIAEKGHGSFLNKTSIAVPEIPEKQILSSITLGVNSDEKTILLAKRDKVRSLGSASLEMCMVAMGGLDFFIVGREYLRVTDIAASTLIVREAGGVVTDVSGKKLDMPLDLHSRASVIAACNKDLVVKITEM